MNQFRTALVGGYLKDEVDERLRSMAEMIAQLKKEAQSREEQLQNGSEGETKRLAELREQYESQLSLLKKQLAEKDRALEEAAERISRLERQGCGESEQVRQLQQQLADGERSWGRKEADYQKQIKELQENADSQKSGSAAAARLLVLAEQEADTIVADAKVKAIVCEQKAMMNIDAKKRAALQALEEAQGQVSLYLEAFRRTQDALTESYQELGILIKTIPEELSEKTKGRVIDLDKEKDVRHRF